MTVLSLSGSGQRSRVCSLSRFRPPALAMWLRPGLASLLDWGQRRGRAPEECSPRDLVQGPLRGPSSGGGAAPVGGQGCVGLSSCHLGVPLSEQLCCCFFPYGSPMPSKAPATGRTEGGLSPTCPRHKVGPGSQRYTMPSLLSGHSLVQLCPSSGLSGPIHRQELLSFLFTS